MDKEQLTEQAIEKALEWASAAEGFVVEQAPEVCREIMVFGQVKSIACGVAIALVGAALTAYVLWLVCAFRRDAFCDSNEGGFGFAVFGVLATAGWTGLAIAYVFNGLTVWFAPRLYVLEVLRRLL